LLLNRRKLLADAKVLGRWGEKRCERYLKRKGLKKLTRNFSCKTGEIDLVMVDNDGSIVFVEVRTKAGKIFETHNIENRPYRFDVVTIVLGQTGQPKIKHYKSAFVP